MSDTTRKVALVTGGKGCGLGHLDIACRDLDALPGRPAVAPRFRPIDARLAIAKRPYA